MATRDNFNPFTILPRSLMLRVLFHTFKDDAKADFKNFMDYNTASKELRDIISDIENVKYIADSLPKEFNINLGFQLRTAKLGEKNTRFRAALCFLFLKYIYSHVKPFPKDEFIINQYDYYFDAIKHIQKEFHDYPMVMYINGYVGFTIAKRLLTVNPQDNELKNKGGALFTIASECMIQADKLEVPIAKLFLNDMHLQMVRADVDISKYIKGNLKKAPPIDLQAIVDVLAEDIDFDINEFDDEQQNLLFVTWQKLTIENCFKARELFKLAHENKQLMRLSDFFFQVFVANHYHRYVLAYNPFFVHSDRQENIIALLNQYNVEALVHLHQGFRVYYPKPDSVLLSTLLTMPVERIKSFNPLINNILLFPQKGTPAWKVNFIDAYRAATDDGSLKTITHEQMEMTLNYFILVDRAADITQIMERDAYVVNKILHCNDSVVHKIGLAIIRRLMNYNTFDPLGHLNNQEILLTCLYKDREHLHNIKIKSDQDYDRIASTFIDCCKKQVSTNASAQKDISVPEYMHQCKDKIKLVHDEIHCKLADMNYLKAA